MKTKKLFDIFSAKKLKSTKEQEEKIVVDYREKNSLVYSELIELGLKVEIKELKVADYIAKDVAVERKTISDFLNSMINKRLSKQLQELQQYKNRLLIIEGTDEQEIYTDGNSEGIHPNSVRGFLLSILLRYNIPIIFTKDYRDTAKFLSVLARRKEKPASLNVSKKSFTKKERLQFILESFPGIGPKTAQKLLAHFKSIKNVINASEEELTDLIGKKARIIKELSESEYQ